MPGRTASVLLSHLRNHTALVVARPVRSAHRHSALHATALAISGLIASGLIALPGHAMAQDESLPTAGDVLDISTTGDRTIGSLSGVDGTSVILGPNRLTTSSPNNTLFAGVISGTGGLTKAGFGTLTLTGANTYAGITTIAGGTLALASGGALNASQEVNLSEAGSNFDVSGVIYQSIIGTLSGVAGTQVNLGSKNLIYGNELDREFAGNLIGTTGTVTKTGTGTSTLNGDNSGFGGRFNVYDGGLIVTSLLGSVDGYIADPTLTGTNPSVTLRGTGAHWDITDNLYVRGGGTSALLIEDGAKASNNFGVIGAAGTDAAVVTVTGAGSLWTNRNTLIVGDGATTSKNGVLRILDGGTVTSAEGRIASGNGTGATGLIEVAGIGSSWTNTGELRIGDLSGSGTLRISGGGQVASGLTRVGTMTNGVGTATLSGTGSLWNVTGNLEIGFGSFLSYGSGTVNVSDSAVLKVGATGSGTIYLAQSGIAPGLGTTGTLNIGGVTDNAADALSAGVVQAGELRLGSGAATLRFNHTDSNYLFDTKLIGTSTTASIKQVAGTTILTADNSGYTAATRVSGGTLIVRGKHGGDATVTGGTLQFGDATGGQNSTLKSITVSGAGSVLGFHGQGSASVSGAVGLQADTVLSVHAGASTPALTADTIAIGGGTTFNLSGISGSSQLPLTLMSTTNGIIGDFANVTVGGFSGPVDYMTLNTRKSDDGLTYLADYYLSWTAGNNLAHGTFTLADASEYFSVQTALSDQAPNAATGWDGISLTKAGDGHLVLAADNTYSGDTIINGGLLTIGAGGTAGSVAGNIVNNAGLAFDRSDNITYSGVISGAGSVSQNGTGTLTLTGANTFTDRVSINSGTLAIGAGGSLSSSVQVGLDTGTVFDISAAGDQEIGNVVGTSGAEILLGANNLTLASGVNSSFDGVISGTGGLVIGPSGGIVRLTGANTYTGDTVLNNGLLLFAPDGNGSGGSIVSNIVNNGHVSVTRDTDFSYAGDISGTGNLAKSGGAKLILSGTHTYTGYTVVAESTIAIVDGGSSSAATQLTLSTDGIFDISGANNSQSIGGLSGSASAKVLLGANNLTLGKSGNYGFAGVISGSGGILIDHEGSMYLVGDNTYTGDTVVNRGNLIIGDGGSTGSVAGNIVNNSSLTFRRGDDHSYAGTISGTGNLSKLGAGTLTLSGINSYGNTAVEAGKLVGTLSSISGNIALANGATLSLIDQGISTYSGNLSGAGRFDFDGSGSLLLTADSSAFTGQTYLNSGTLLVGSPQSAGKLGGSLNVASGATLGGSGTLGSGAGSLVTIASGGILSPGNSIGTLTIDGDLHFTDAAKFVIEVDPSGTASDQVVVTGKATLNGGTVTHIGATGHYNPRSTYTILKAGQLTGTFGSVTSDFAFLNPTLIYDHSAGTVKMDLLRNDRDFAAVAQTRNQRATANAIESIGLSAAHAVYDAVVQMTDDAAEIRRSFDQLSGELHATARATQLEDSRFVRNAANGRLRAAFGQSPSDHVPALAYAANGTPVAVDATYDGAAFWAQSYGSWGSFDADAATTELDRQIGGAILGGDVRLNNWRVGALAGYSRSEIRTEGQKAVSDTNVLGLYAGTRWGKASLRLALAQSWHDVDTNRSVRITGFNDYVEAEYSATTRQAFAETDYALISRERSQLQAFANVAQVSARTDAFAETGGDASLDSAKADNDVTFTTLGLRGSRQIKLGETAAMLRGSAGWRNASGDVGVEGLHAFSAGDAFTVAGAPIAEDAAVIETGMDVRFNARTTFGLTYTGQFSDTAEDHGFNARLSINF